MSFATDLRWLGFFPVLNSINDVSWKKALNKAVSFDVKAGEMIFHAGEPCENYLFVLAGTVRVQKTSIDGHVITLYRLQSGDTCELTTSCLLSDDYYHAEAIAESPVTIVLLPKESFKKALLESPEFSRYVYKSVEKGINILLGLIEDVAFGPVDLRLAKNLMSNKNQQDEVCSTHYEIASNLGTAREVVSRILKRFERNAWVKLSRGKIVVLNSQALSGIHLH